MAIVWRLPERKVEGLWATSCSITSSKSLKGRLAARYPSRWSAIIFEDFLGNIIGASSI